MTRPSAAHRASSLLKRFGIALATLFMVAITSNAFAAPEAHILRIDPRAGVSGGKPVLTTVIEVVQFKRLSEVLQPCASESNYERSLTCWSDKIETPGALWSPFPFPEAAAHFLVSVAGQDKLSGFVDKTVWGQAKAQPGVGTAWLITLDASNGMGSRYAEAQKVAYEFLQSMQANDLVDLMIFDDRQVIKDSKWKAYKDRNAVVALLQSQPSVAPKHGSDRALFNQIKQMTTDGFGSLGNSDSPDTIPLHQAMVVLSDGSGRGDAASASPSADVFHQYMDDGRFGGNDATPKTPLPVISIWFPATGGGIVTDLYKNNDAQFMQALGNPEIGGFFDIVQAGQGDAKGKTIIGLVRARFDAMWLIHWKLSCVNPSVLQSFNLVFENTKPQILPDATFKNVPLGIDPTQWPLDVDFDKTTKEAQANPLFPGGQFRIYGDFCWGGDKGRAESYFIPAGTKPDPNATNSRDPELAKKAMQQLIAQNMRGGAVEVGDTFATMMIPDDDKILEGTGDNTVARVVLYDNNAHRASAIDQKTVLSLKATKKPLPWLIILGVALGVIAILLLVVVLMRSGGGGKKGRGGPPPQQAPPPGYGGPPYGGPPQGGPYQQMSSDPYAGGAQAYGGGGAQAMMGAPQPAYAGGAPVDPRGGVAPMGAPMAAPLVSATPMAPAPPIDLVAAAPAVVQVRCPACQMMTMATPGQPSVCFSCGQPLPANIAAGGGGAVNAPTFPLTGAMSSVLAPPPNPYGASPGGFGGGASAASISGSHGHFSIRPGGEVRVGRDAAQCPIFLSEPRVSGVHSSLKFESGQLWARDETSNNGTWIAGSRIAPGTWVAVPPGAQLRFGPIEFNVTFEA